MDANFYKGQARAGQGNEPPLIGKSLSEPRLSWMITQNKKPRFNAQSWKLIIDLKSVVKEVAKAYHVP